MEKSYVIPTQSGDITLTTGKIATLSAGAIMLQKGGTVILATADVASEPSLGMDMVPLTVEYLERYYAQGVLSGSRFKKREGNPSDSAITVARQIDHTIRPLFPKNFHYSVNVLLTVMADDGVNNPEDLTVIGASAALMASGIPFAGPVASAVVAVHQDGSLEINPKLDPLHNHEESLLGEFIVAGGNGKVLNLEGWGKELGNDVMNQVIDTAMSYIADVCAKQMEFIKEVGKPTMEYTPDDVPQELKDAMYQNDAEAIKAAIYVADKKERGQAKTKDLMPKLFERYATEETGYSQSQVREAFEYVAKKIMREGIVKDEKRFSNRGLQEIRPLSAEVDILPTVHGSALFNRGYTQSLSIVTLGSTAKSKAYNDMSDEDTIEPFMHHYNFPPFSTGEAGRVRYRPGRREIGHGAIGFNALKHMIPNQSEFPYTIRVVSEITTSNGSTSMAATCASSMALMAAGVPMKASVGGIGVGLITGDEAQNDYKLLLDIEGVEDFYGDMDFKVTGSRTGMTAVQFETKLKGVKPEIIKEAFELSTQGRMQVLDVMDGAISESRTELAATAPRVEVVAIPQDKIGEIIGPSGKVIKAMIAGAEALAPGAVEIDINDDGRATVTTASQLQRDYVMAQIEMIIEGPKVGEIYHGTVKSILEFGAFIEIAPGVEGLLHISEISNERVERVEDVLQVGQEVDVRLIDKQPGRFSLSIKHLNTPMEEIPKKEPRERRGFGDRGDRGGDRGGFRGGDRGDRGGDRGNRGDRGDDRGGRREGGFREVRDGGFRRER